MSGKEDYLAQLGKNVKKLRESRKLSLEELGLEIGSSRMQVHRIEKGYNVTLTTIVKLALALNVEPWDLLAGLTKDRSKRDLEELINTSKSTRSKKRDKKK